MSLLILPARSTSVEDGIWREAIRRKWNIERIDPTDDKQVFKSDDCIIRYYGNVLDYTRFQFRFNLEVEPLSPWAITNLPFNVLGRSIQCGKYKDLEQPFKKELFVKCVNHKWFPAKVYSIGESILSSSQPDDLIYVQDVVHFQHEIRCFTVNGKVLTASWYRKDGVFSPEHLEDVPQSVTELVEVCSHKYPRGVVLDFGLIDGRWYLIEANEAWASGLYDCDPSKAFDCIVASQSS